MAIPTLPASITLFNRPDLMEVICLHVSEGGTLIDLCRTWEVPFSHVMRFIRSHPEKLKQYNAALEDRTEWVKERVLSELRSIGTAEIDLIYNLDGTIKPFRDWPEAARRSLQAIEVEEIWAKGPSGREQVGTTTKVRFYDKLKASDMLGKQARLWSESKEGDNASVSLADLIALAKLAPPVGESK